MVQNLTGTFHFFHLFNGFVLIFLVQHLNDQVLCFSLNAWHTSEFFLENFGGKYRDSNILWIILPPVNANTRASTRLAIPRCCSISPNIFYARSISIAAAHFDCFSSVVCTKLEVKMIVALRICSDLRLFYFAA